jgi:AcrR family transcriptional regulator
MSPKMLPEYFDYRQKQILKAARECFTEKGYHETTIRDIAKRINISPGVIYNFFKNKDEMLLDLQKLNLVNQQQIFEMMARMKSSRDAIIELFRQHLECVPIEELRNNARVNIGMWAEAIKRGSYKKIFVTNYVDLHKNISKIIKSGIQRNEIDESFDPETISGLFISILMGLQVQLVLLDKIDIEVHIRNVKNIVSQNIWRDVRENSD